MTTRAIPSVAVIIPYYNASAFIRRAIESACAQTHQPAEIIVVDDGSSDDVELAVGNAGERVRIFRQVNSGPAAARNRGIAAAGAEYVALLDADDCWHPEKLARQVEILNRDRTAVLVHTDVQLIDETGAAIPRSLRFKRGGNCFAPDFVKHDFVTTSSVLLRRAILPTDPFDVNLRTCEDWDLWLRLAAKYPFAYVPEKLTFYRVHSANTSSARSLMAGSTVQMLDRLLARDVPPDVMRAALACRREWLRELGHCRYEQGRIAEARRAFLAAGLPRDRVSALRLLGTLLPSALIGRARRAWGAVRATFI